MFSRTMFLQALMFCLKDLFFGSKGNSAGAFVVSVRGSAGSQCWVNGGGC